MTGKTIRRRACILLATTILAAAGAGWDGPGAAVAQTVNQAYAFDIPAKPIRQAMNDIVRVTGIDVVFEETPAASSIGRPVRGTMTPSQAVGALLAGTGLSYRFTTGNTVTIGDPAAARGAGVAADGSTVLDPLVITGTGGVGADFDPYAIYTTPGAVYNVNREMMDRAPGTSTSDIFRGVPGVQVGDGRSGASFEPNIRGGQGQGRVKVIVDGTETRSAKRTLYAGIQERNYVDPDFIAGFDVTKGPDSESGSIAGTINMRTFNADDLITDPSRKWGLRVSGMFANNTSDDLETVNYCNTSNVDRKNACFAGQTYTHPTTGVVYDDRAVHNVEANIPSVNASGSVIGAWKPYDPLEVVLGYSRRASGNYHAGSNGTNPRLSSPSNPTLVDGRPTGYFSYFNPGDEVYGTFYDTQSVLAKAKVELPNDQSLSFSYNHYDSEFGRTLFMDGVSGLSVRQFYMEPSRTRQGRYSADYTWRPDNDWWDVKASVYRVDTEEDQSDVSAAGRETIDVVTWGANLGNTSRFDVLGRPATLKTGLSWSRDSADVERINGLASGYFELDVYDASKTDYGAYANLSVDLTDWLTVDAGLRHDRFSSSRDDTNGYSMYTGRFTEADGHGTSPNVGVTVSPWESVQFYGRWSEGWRAPSYNESFQYNCNGTANTANEYACVPGPIRPEQSQNLELGVNVAHSGFITEGDRLGLKFSYFNNRYKDYITGIGSSINPYVNRPSATFKGIEIAANYDMGRFFGEYTLTHFIDTEICRAPGDYWLIYSGAAGVCSDSAGQTSSFRPQADTAHTLTLGMRAFDDRLTLGARGHFVNGTGITPTASVTPLEQFDSYQVYDLWAKYRHDNLDVALSVENVADKYYFDAGTSSYLTLPAPGRTVRLKITKTF